MNKHYLDGIARIARVGLAAVFLLSGIAKLVYFSDTVAYFLEFSFMAPLTALFASSALVAMEFTLGVALMLERNPKAPLSASSAVLLVFTIYQIIIMLFPAAFTRTCPCFGASEVADGANFSPLIRNVILLVVSLACYFYHKRKSVFSGGPVSCEG